MTRAQKAVVIDDIAERLEDAQTIYLTNYSGLTVEQANELRNQFREAEVEYKVLKNTLIRLAMERVGGYDEIVEYLHGPTAVAFCEAPAAPAQVIKDFTKEQDVERPELKAALVEGDLYGADALDALAALKSREELIGDILGLLLGPITNVVGGLQGQGENLAGAIKTLAEKEE